MVHGDDQGLILPPRLAPHQVVIVPIFKTDEEKALVFEAAKKIRAQLVKANIRVKVDEREGQSPGFKFNDWEMRGVPLRMEIGPKDVAKGSVVLARRDRPGKEGKSFVSQEGIAESVEQLLAAIQKALFDRALEFRNTHTLEPKSVEDFRLAVEQGFARSHWCGDSKCEEQIKENTKATLRCIPMEQPGGTGPCLFCGKPSSEVAVFGKAY
jgi:prolyl-tRNA synthetase